MANLSVNEIREYLTEDIQKLNRTVRDDRESNPEDDPYSAQLFCNVLWEIWHIVIREDWDMPQDGPPPVPYPQEPDNLEWMLLVLHRLNRAELLRIEKTLEHFSTYEYPNE